MISPQLTERPPLATKPADALIHAVGLTCVVIQGESCFREVEPVWRELHQRAANPTPCVEWAWLTAWWEVFGAVCPKTRLQGRPYFLVVYSGPIPVAVYPFLSRAEPWWSPRLRRLRPMGYSGELEPSGLTEEPVAMIATGFEEECLEAVTAYLIQVAGRADWDSAMIRQRFLGRETPRGVSPSRLSGFRVVASSKSKEGPQIVALPVSWAAFRKQLSKSMRDNLPYYPRLLARNGHMHEVSIVRDPAEIAEAARSLVELHRRRVFSDVGQTHQDYFTHAWQPEMLVLAFTRLATEGKGFIATLKVDGAVVAAQAFLQSGCELLVHYSGFDPEFAKFSPLLVLQSEVFRQAIESGKVRRLNLLYGNAPWQKRWSSQAEGREIKTLLIRTRPLSMLRCALYVVARESLAFCRRSGLRRWLVAKLRR